MTIFDAPRNHDLAPPLHPDRLGLGMLDAQVRCSRKHVLWRDPEEIRANVVTVLAMIAAGIVGGFLIMIGNQNVTTATYAAGDCLTDPPSSHDNHASFRVKFSAGAPIHKVRSID